MNEDLQRVVKTSPYWWFARWLIDLCDPNRSLGDPRWRPEYDQLAQYNAEKARGIMHTPEHAAAMTKLQDDFNRSYHATRHE